jgi:PIN domain nuclease of toxin-antitoxin system
VTVLDTHAWIWWRSDPSRLGRRAKKEIDGAKRLGLSAISVWELSMLVRKKRLELDRDLLEWAEGALEDPRLELLPLTPAVAVLGSELEIQGDPGDRIIAATALLAGATLVTKDARLQGYGPLKTVW